MRPFVRQQLMRLICVLTLVFAGSAQAGLIIADPDEFSVGDDLTTAFVGITLSIEGAPSNTVLVRDGTFTDGPRNDRIFFF